MSYKFLEDVAIADIAIEVRAATLDDLFGDAAAALAEQTVNTENLTGKIEKSFELESEDIEGLLFDFIAELLYLKDAEQFLFRDAVVKIRKGDKYLLSAKLKGDLINRTKQELRNDIKAITMHMFEVRQADDGWEATFVVDI